jgi:hypothetical protein
VEFENHLCGSVKFEHSCDLSLPLGTMKINDQLFENLPKLNMS